jgi:hypothetical protein
VNDITGSTHCYGKTQQDGKREIFLKLPGAAKLAGWPTATTRDWKDGASVGTVKTNGLLGRVVWLAGQTQNPSSAEMEKPAAPRLNPLFSLWLMGFPPQEWSSCAELAMPSSRKSQRSLSEHISTVSKKTGFEEEWI